MASHATEVDRVPTFSCKPKVYYSICCKLVEVSEKIIRILPAIESARPGCSSGIQALCSLSNALEKTKLLVRHCSESSKMYLAIKALSIASRCERIQTQLNKCLCQIQTMVPSLLASQIAEILVYVRHVKFIINPEEEEAGKVLSNLLSQIDSSEDQEFEAFHIAASRLKIRSSVDLLVERRAIQNLLDKFLGIDKEERTLKYFLYLIKKHGNQLSACSGELRGNSSGQDNILNEVTNSESDACMIGENSQPHSLNVEIQRESFNSHMPPENFCCPISSSLMYDPVAISSGQTYERIFIEKWFREGHDTCPKTQIKLENLSLIPNSSMKDLVSSWCQNHDVIVVDPRIRPNRDCLIESERNISSSYSGSSFCSDSSHDADIQNPNNDCAQLFTWSNDYQKYQSFSSFSQDMYLKFLFELSELPTLQQVKAVDDIKNFLEGNEVTHCDMLSSGFAEALVKFLKKARSLFDLDAQRSGAQIFLALFTNKRWDLIFENETTINLLSSFLSCGIEKEAMMILQKLVLRPNYVSWIVSSSIPLEIMNFVNSEDAESAKIAVIILSELSSHGEMKYHFRSPECIERIAQLLNKRNMVSLCLNILQNLADDEEASMLISDSTGCIASMAELLEFGSPDEQEQTIAILLLICSRSLRNCLVVLKEGVVPSIVNISVTGNATGKENSMKLLHVLRNIRDGNCLDTPQPHSEVESESECLDSPQPHSEVESESDCLDSPQPHSEVESVVVQHPKKISKKLILSYRSLGFFSRKIRRISKSFTF
ncbi:U-box domain-containing protein 5 [Platanthera zijinensis]|uniref:RING-type E3 ubiquitin transferase n=1 Tax=Platanthera zijinensis TaxID=2320716 RepID=A0AAP0BIR6_9ASPA